MADEAFHEIQLNGKQLVFLFMAATVVAVVIFLMGVMVGRGVATPRNVQAANLAAEASVDPTSVVQPPAPPATATTQGAPVASKETLTYPNRLESPNPPPESLKEPGAARGAAGDSLPKPAAEPKPAAVRTPPPPPASTSKPPPAKPAPPETAKPAPAEAAKPATPAPATTAKPAPPPPAKPEAAKSAPPPAKPETAKPAPAQTAKPETAKPETAKPAPPQTAKPETAKPAPPQPKPPSAAAVEGGLTEPPGTGFVVQVAAVKERSEAETIARRLSAKGYPTFITTNTGPVRMFRVRVGKYQNRREAESIAGRLEKEEQFKPWITR